MALERELETYRKHLPELLAQRGLYALVHGDAVSGVFPTYTEALTAGYERFEFKPFLVKQIQEAEKALYFSREVKPPCPT